MVSIISNSHQIKNINMSNDQDAEGMFEITDNHHNPQIGT